MIQIDNWIYDKQPSHLVTEERMPKKDSRSLWARFRTPRECKLTNHVQFFKYSDIAYDWCEECEIWHYHSQPGAWKKTLRHMFTGKFE